PGLGVPGRSSRTILGAPLPQRPSTTNVKIKGRSAGSTQRAADWIKENYPQLEDVRIVETEEEAIRDSDIVITGTSTSPDGPSGFPYLKKEYLKPGALLLMPAAARLDDELVQSDDCRLVVDYTG